MRIRSVEPFILHVLLNVDFISDSTHTSPIGAWWAPRSRPRTGTKDLASLERTRIYRRIDWLRPVLPKATHHSS